MKKWLALVVVITVLLVTVIVVAVSAQEKEDPAASSPTEPAATTSSWQEEKGVLITGLTTDGPAAAAGLRRGDIILAVDGQEVNSPADVQEIVRGMDAGQQVTLSAQRCEQVEEIVVTLGEMDGTGRGYLGVSLYPPLTGERQFVAPFAEKAQPLLAEGALVVAVEADTPAAAAGLQEGDRILALDGTEVTLSEPLTELVRAQAVGDEVELTVMRGDTELTLTAVLTEHPDEAGVPYLGVRVAPAMGAWHALDVAPLAANGVQVTSVDEGSPAEQAGIEPDDLIVAIDGEEVQNSQALIGAIRSHQPGDTISVTVERGGEELSLEVTLGSQNDNAGETAYLGIHFSPVMRWQGNLRQFQHDLPFGPGQGNPDWLPFDSNGQPLETEPHEFLLPRNPRYPLGDSAQA
jgi:S1-C subfamily serine protease